MKLRGIALGCVLMVLAGAAMAQVQSPSHPPVPPLALLSRWAHIFSAIVLLGGSLFTRLWLHPAAMRTLGPEDHARLRSEIMRSWRKAVMFCILLFLVSGFYNYYLQMPRHDGHALYHALFGIKLILALVVFALASILVSGRQRPSAIRSDAPKWLLITVLLAIAVVLIGGYMKLS